MTVYISLLLPTSPCYLILLIIALGGFIKFFFIYRFLYTERFLISFRDGVVALLFYSHYIKSYAKVASFNFRIF